jgi:hypothetical protein
MKIRNFALAGALLLAGCGGGGGNPGTCMASALTCAAIEAGSNGTPPASTISDAAGLFNGTTSTSRTASALVLADGTFWLLYSPVGNPALIAGAEQGHLTGGAGRFTSGDIVDVGLESMTAAQGTAVGTYVPRASAAGTVSFGAQSVGFTATYDQTYGTAATLGAVAGSYSGTGVVLGGSETVRLSVSSTGVIAGSGTSGCSFTGTAIPNPGVNSYAVTVTFGGAPCSNANSTVSGVAYMNATTQRLYSAALNPGRTNGFLFVGTKGT